MKTRKGREQRMEARARVVLQGRRRNRARGFVVQEYQKKKRKRTPNGRKGQEAKTKAALGTQTWNSSTTARIRSA
jgi:hypothetical protein